MRTEKFSSEEQFGMTKPETIQGYYGEIRLTQMLTSGAYHLELIDGGNSRCAHIFVEREDVQDFIRSIDAALAGELSQPVLGVSFAPTEYGFFFKSTVSTVVLDDEQLRVFISTLRKGTL